LYTCIFYVCMTIFLVLLFFFFNDPLPSEIYTLSLHDAFRSCFLIISFLCIKYVFGRGWCKGTIYKQDYQIVSAKRLFKKLVILRSEEHTSELQSPCNLVCRLLLEKKNRTAEHTSVLQSLTIN